MMISGEYNGDTRRKKLLGKGREVITTESLQYPQCLTVFSFEPTRWRVLTDIPEM